MKNSISEFIFSILLFLMLVIGSFFMIYFGGNIYQKAIAEGNKREAVEIPLAYLSNKLYAAESKNSVHISSIEDIDVLVIEQKEMVTCIYVDEGNLKELNMKSVESFKKENGTDIYALDALQMSENDGEYSFVVTKDDLSDSVKVTLR